MLVAAIALATTPLMPPHAPKWLDMSIVGYSVTSGRELFLQDRKTGYFLVHTLECDDEINYLMLTRDHSLVGGAGNEVISNEQESEVNTPIVKSFRKLSTGKGVTIGNTPNQLKKRLGKPTKIERSGSRKQFVDYVYHFMGKTRDRDNPHAFDTDEYTETYTFKKGALIQIIFDHGSGPR